MDGKKGLPIDLATRLADLLERQLSTIEEILAVAQQQTEAFVALQAKPVALLAGRIASLADRLADLEQERLQEQHQAAAALGLALPEAGLQRLAAGAEGEAGPRLTALHEALSARVELLRGVSQLNQDLAKQAMTYFDLKVRGGAGGQAPPTYPPPGPWRPGERPAAGPAPGTSGLLDGRA